MRKDISVTPRIKDSWYFNYLHKLDTMYYIYIYILTEAYLYQVYILVSLFNGISTFMDYIMPKSSL